MICSKSFLSYALQKAIAAIAKKISTINSDQTTTNVLSLYDKAPKKREERIGPDMIKKS
jgi:hypothetical protein